MRILTSDEYVKKISELKHEAELRKDYEAELICIGKDAPYQIEDAYNQGINTALMHIFELYNQSDLNDERFEDLLFEAKEHLKEGI